MQFDLPSQTDTNLLLNSSLCISKESVSRLGGPTIDLFSFRISNFSPYSRNAYTPNPQHSYSNLCSTPTENFSGMFSYPDESIRANYSSNKLPSFTRIVPSAAYNNSATKNTHYSSYGDVVSWILTYPKFHFTNLPLKFSSLNGQLLTGPTTLTKTWLLRSHQFHFQLSRLHHHEDVQPTQIICQLQHPYQQVSHLLKKIVLM